MSTNKLFIALCICVGTLSVMGAAQAGIIKATASLDYDQEVGPSNPSPSDATGVATLWFDTSTNLVDLVANVVGISLADVTFPGGSPLAFGANGPFHIHDAPAGVNGPIVVPFREEDFFADSADGLTITVDDVPYDGTLSGPELISKLRDGGLYLNLHTLDYASGEIRGQLQVPVPASALLVLAGLAGLALRRRMGR
jgi:hypothetical protein